MPNIKDPLLAIGFDVWYLFKGVCFIYAQLICCSIYSIFMQIFK